MSTMPAQSIGVPDRGPSVFAVITATLVLASAFVAARLYTRIVIMRHLSPDDYFIMLSWVLAFAVCLTIDIGAKNGLGKHDEDIGDDQWPALRRCEYAFSILYVRTVSRLVCRGPN
jgi:hypothetical protein